VSPGDVIRLEQGNTRGMTAVRVKVRLGEQLKDCDLCVSDKGELLVTLGHVSQVSHCMHVWVVGLQW